MWHLVLAMLQACLAWYFGVHGQPDSQNIESAKVIHTQDRLNFPFGFGSSGFVQTSLLSWWKVSPNGTGGSMFLSIASAFLGVTGIHQLNVYLQNHQECTPEGQTCQGQGKYEGQTPRSSFHMLHCLLKKGCPSISTSITPKRLKAKDTP